MDASWSATWPGSLLPRSLLQGEYGDEDHDGDGEGGDEYEGDEDDVDVGSDQDGNSSGLFPWVIP